MSNLITGKHVVMNRNPQLAPITENPLPLPEGEILVVPAGHMISVETGTEDASGAVQGYRSLVVKAVEDLTISGPAYVSSPKADKFDEILREERSWVRKHMIKMILQVAFIGGLIMLIAGATIKSMQTWHHLVLLAVFLAIAVGMAIFVKRRLSPTVEHKESTA